MQPDPRSKNRVMPQKQCSAQRDPKRCPDDPAEMAEAYLMNRIAPDVAADFEKHYIVCEACAAVLGEAEDYITSLKEAARRFSQSARTERFLFIVDE
jgi:hypothetical protein